jgi:hypothetical protein
LCQVHGEIKRQPSLDVEISEITVKINNLGLGICRTFREINDLAGETALAKRLALTLTLSPGEREPAIAAPRKVTAQWSLPVAGNTSPSPWGEGRGEGEL